MSEPASATTRRRVRLPYPLALSVFLVQVAVGIVLFSLFQEYVPRQLGAGDAWAGYLLSAYGGARFLFEAPTGAISDRIERKLSLLIGYVLMLPALVLMAIFRDEYAYLVFSAMLGLATAFLWPATYSMAADLYPATHRGQVIGLLNLGQLFGFGVGALLGALVVESAPAILFAAAIVSVAAALTAASLGVPSYRSAGLFRRVHTPNRSPVWAIMTRRLAILSALVLLVSAAVSMMIPAIRPYGTDELGVSFAKLTAALIPAIVVAALFYIPAGRLADRFGRMRPLIAGELLVMVGLFGVAATASLPVAAALAGLIFIGNVLTVPAWNAAIMDLAPETHRGAIIGLSVALSGLGLAIGPAVGGILVEQLGPVGTLRVGALVCGTTGVLIAAYAWSYRTAPLPTAEHA